MSCGKEEVSTTASRNPRASTTCSHPAFAAVENLKTALLPDLKLLKEMPAGARRGSNADAFPGGFRLWAKDGVTI
jgi:hypothetical protein